MRGARTFLRSDAGTGTREVYYILLNSTDHDWFVANPTPNTSLSGGLHILNIPCGPDPSVAANKFKMLDEADSVIFDSATVTNL